MIVYSNGEMVYEEIKKGTIQQVDCQFGGSALFYPDSLFTGIYMEIPGEYGAYNHIDNNWRCCCGSM